MSISTYTELQTAISNELERSDLIARIPEFITRCESKINRKLQHYSMFDLTTLSYTSSSKFVSLPAGFLELMSLHIKAATASDNKYRNLIYIAPESIAEKYESTAGEPNYYTLRNNLELNLAANQNYTLRIHYRKALDIEADITNWLLTSYPDIYLYGACVEAEAYLMNDARIALWRAGFLECVEDINELSERSEDDAILLIDPVLTANSNSFNIITN